MDEQNDVMVESPPESPEPESTDTPVFYTDDDMREAYRLASERGMDETDILSMKENEFREFIGKGKSTETQTAPSAKEQPTEAGTEPTSAQPEAVASTTATAEQPAIDANQKRIEDLLKVTGTQANELGQLRAVVQQYKPFLEALNDPRFQSHMMAFFDSNTAAGVATQQQPQPPIEVDPFNPQSIDQLVQNRVAAALTAKERAAQEAAQRQQQMLRQNTFQSGLQASIAKVSAETGQPTEIIEGIVKTFVQEIVAGQNIADHAIKSAFYKNAIAEARKDGEAEAIKKLTTAQQQNAVPRTAAAQVAQTSNKKSGETNDLSQMTAQELGEYIDKHERFSPEWERAVRHGQKVFNWM